MELTNELVVMAPIQVKGSLSPGNIYDLTLIDFYAKTRQMQGFKVSVPIFWNVNGLPVLNMMQKQGLPLSRETRNEFVNKCIRDGLEILKKHYINFDEQIKDDEISPMISKFIETYSKSIILRGPISIAICEKCGSDFGTDAEIILCKICGGSVSMQVRDVLFQKVSRDDVSNKIGRINIYPTGAKKELITFNESMPEEYNICLTKRREYTISYAGFDLDPRFIVMLTPALVDGMYSRRVYFHGDIIKKFSYYSLCHLPDRFLPTDIVCHGVLLDKYGRKIRWQDIDEDLLNQFNNLPKNDLRAFLLKRNVSKDVLIDFETIHGNLREQDILRNRMDGILGYSDCLESSLPFLVLRKEFFEAVDRYFYGVAYDKMLKIVDLLENKTGESIHNEERKFLDQLRYLYFGEYHGIKN